MKRAVAVLIAALPALIFLGAWQLFVGGDSRLQFLFGSPLLVLEVARADFTHGALYNDIAVTAGETLLGLAAGTILGTTAGLLLWTNEAAARVARPYIVILGSVPIFAVAPMMIIWFGTELLSKVVMAAFAVFFVSLSHAYDGGRVCAAEHGHYARIIAAPRRRVIAKIIVPGALRWVAAGFKINVGLAVLGAFIGEFVSSQAGLGHYILAAGNLYDMPRVLLGVALISVLALAITALVWLLELKRPAFFAR